MTSQYAGFMTPCDICGSMTDKATIRCYGKCNNCRAKVIARESTKQTFVIRNRRRKKNNNNGMAN